MSNGAAAEHIDFNWEGTNGEWRGEFPEITEIREKENPVDHSRDIWRRKIDAALISLRRDEQMARENILSHHPPRQMVLECED